MKLTAFRDREAQQLLGGKAEGMFLVHRRHVVEAVEIGECLQVGLVFYEFLGAAMEQADMWIDTGDDLAIKLEHQT